MKKNKDYLKELAEEIAEEVNETGVEEAEVVKEGDCYRSWAVVEDAPDLDDMIDEAVCECAKENDFDFDERVELKSGVYYYSLTKDELIERAIENYDND